MHGVLDPLALALSRAHPSRATPKANPQRIREPSAEEIRLRIRERDLTRELAAWQAKCQELEAEIEVIKKRKKLDPIAMLSKKRPRLNDIITFVCIESNLTVEEILGMNRCQRTTRPRHIAMYLARRTTLLSCAHIARAFNDRDHSCVIHAFSAVEKRRANDEKFNERVNEWERRLREEA